MGDSHEDELLDTGGGIKKALAHFKGLPFFALNADLPWNDGKEPALKRMTAAWKPEAMDVLLLLKPTKEAPGFDSTKGDFALDPNGRARRKDVDPPRPYVMLAAQIVKPELFAPVSERIFSNNVIWNQAEARQRLYGIVHDGACHQWARPPICRPPMRGRWRIAPMKNVFTIAPGTAFIEALAEGLMQRAEGGAFALADARVFLPTRRACRYLHDAFLHRMQGGALLLPRMQSIGDIDEEELYFAPAPEIGEALDPALPPAIAPLRRQLLLTQLVRGKEPEMPLDQAALLAEALARFLDEMQIMRCDPEKLAGLVEQQDLARHWQETVRFLDIVTKAWPPLLKGEGALDPAARRNKLLETQAALWRETPPQFPVIAAGSTGSQPATAEFLDTIAGLPQGAVILPGLDRELDEEAWQAVGDGHPQQGLKELLEKFGVARKDVKPWGDAKPSPRVRLLQEAMRRPR